MNATVHEFTAVYPDRKLPAPGIEAHFGAAAGYLSAVEELPGNHDRLLLPLAKKPLTFSSVVLIGIFPIYGLFPMLCIS
jgi:hypothetical protein